MLTAHAHRQFKLYRTRKGFAPIFHPPAPRKAAIFPEKAGLSQSSERESEQAYLCYTDEYSSIAHPM
jgi:hypothetical protein